MYQMPNPTTTVYKYFLPNGKEWTGDVHKMTDGNWMTGESHTPYSVYVVIVPQVLNFPADGFVATQTIFSKVFGNTAITSLELEEQYLNLNTKITELEKLLDESNSKVNSSIGRLDSFVAKSTAQLETKGTGILTDTFPIGSELMLPLSNNTILNNSLSNITFVPTSTAPTYIHYGNAETGLVTEDELLRAKSTKTFIEMVSRIDPYSVPTFESPYEELDLNDVLVVEPTSQVGFEGKVNIFFDSFISLTNLIIPINSSATLSNIKINDTYESDLLLEETDGSRNINIPSQRTNNISFDLQYTEPVAFNSQIFIPQIEDEDGNLIPDITSAEDFVGNPQAQSSEFLELTSDNRVYQKTRLELGKITVSARNYGESADFTNGPYYCKKGTLKSIYFEADEVLETEDSFDNYFNYTILINGAEYDIAPSTRESSKPRLYYINSKLSKETKSDLEQTAGAKFIDSADSVTNWSLKTKISRGILEGRVSPIIQGFHFIYTTSLDGGINV